MRTATRDADPSRQLTGLAAVMGRHAQRLPRAVLVDVGNLAPRLRPAPGGDAPRLLSAAAQILRRGLDQHVFQCADPELVAVAFVAAAEAVLLDSARQGADSFGHRMEALSGLFLPGVLAPQ
ncbi:MAG: hypothetical protein R2724_34955 [Bryobacterales bacterium]